MDLVGTPSHAGVGEGGSWQGALCVSVLSTYHAGHCPLHVQADLAAALQQLLSEAGVDSAAELLPDPGPSTPHPRTARVNTLKMSVEQALQWLRQPPPEHRRKWEAVVSCWRPECGLTSVSRWMLC